MVTGGWMVSDKRYPDEFKIYSVNPWHIGYTIRHLGGFPDALERV